MNEGSKRTIKLLCFAVLGMFTFSFALVPLYDVFCEITGLNGKVELSATTNQTLETEDGRDVAIQFISHNNEQMPWIFRPSEASIKVRTGKYHTTTFYVKNTTSKTMTAQAIPSVAPSNAAAHLKKLECFCFQQQTLATHEMKKMPVVFVIDAGLPADVKTITLSYTFFELGVGQQPAGSTTPKSKTAS